MPSAATGVVRVLFRLGRVAVVVACVATAGWALVSAAPGSPGERAARAAGVLPPDDGSAPASLRAEIAARVAAEHGLDRPLPARIAAYLGRLVRLDLGRSWRDGEGVAPRLGRAARRTLLLIGLALAAAMAFGLAFAVLGARRAGRPIDLALSGVAALAVAIPPAWAGMVALRTLAAGGPLSLFPTGGLESAAAAVLPVATLALVPAFVLARHARAALAEAAVAPWAVAARARGNSAGRVLAVHALRVSAPELLPIVPALAAYLLGASLVVERVFGIRGLGEVILTAAGRGDAPVLVGGLVAAAAFLAAVSEATDAAVTRLDPRRRDPEVSGA